jgi:hypothetical protein
MVVRHPFTSPRRFAFPESHHMPMHRFVPGPRQRLTRLSASSLDHALTTPLRPPPDTLSAAAAILGVEAYHAGAIRTLLSGLEYLGQETAYGPISTAVQHISDLRDSADGPDDLDQGILEGGRINIVPVDKNSLVFARSIEQVLAIVYLGAADTPGGFFPEGVNGAVRAGPPACPSSSLRPPVLVSAMSVGRLFIFALAIWKHR